MNNANDSLKTRTVSFVPNFSRYAEAAKKWPPEIVLADATEDQIGIFLTAVWMESSCDELYVESPVYQYQWGVGDKIMGTSLKWEHAAPFAIFPKQYGWWVNRRPSILGEYEQLQTDGTWKKPEAEAAA